MDECVTRDRATNSHGIGKSSQPAVFFEVFISRMNCSVRENWAAILDPFDHLNVHTVSLLSPSARQYIIPHGEGTMRGQMML